MLTTRRRYPHPARILVIGAGVAGLQALPLRTALARSPLPTICDCNQEQVQSLGGRFVELPIEAKDSEDERGYGPRRMRASTHGCVNFSVAQSRRTMWL